MTDEELAAIRAWLKDVDENHEESPGCTRLRDGIGHVKALLGEVDVLRAIVGRFSGREFEERVRQITREEIERTKGH